MSDWKEKTPSQRWTLVLGVALVAVFLYYNSRLSTAEGQVADYQAAARIPAFDHKIATDYSLSPDEEEVFDACIASAYATYVTPFDWYLDMQRRASKPPHVDPALLDKSWQACQGYFAATG